MDERAHIIAQRIDLIVPVDEAANATHDRLALRAVMTTASISN